MKLRLLPAVRRWTLLLMITNGAAVVSPGICYAWHADTTCAWQRTWHAPYAPDMPLRGYFVPRLPGRCDVESPLGGWGCIGSEDYSVHAPRCNCGPHIVGWNGSPPGAIGCGPVGFERLGQIPNDIGLSIGGPVGVPSR